MEDSAVVKTAARVDARTAPLLQEELKQILDEGKVNLVIDMDETKYISSIGLRALIYAQKRVMKENGSMKVIHVRDVILEIFDVTGYSGVLDIC